MNWMTWYLFAVAFVSLNQEALKALVDILGEDRGLMYYRALHPFSYRMSTFSGLASILYVIVTPFIVSRWYLPILTFISGILLSKLLQFVSALMPFKTLSPILIGSSLLGMFSLIMAIIDLL